jgi:hypothetical protein
METILQWLIYISEDVILKFIYPWELALTLSFTVLTIVNFKPRFSKWELIVMFGLASVAFAIGVLLAGTNPYYVGNRNDLIWITRFAWLGICLFGTVGLIRTLRHVRYSYNYRSKR